MKTIILATLVSLATTQALAFDVNHYGTHYSGTSATDHYGIHTSAQHAKLVQVAKQSEQDLYYFQASNGEVVTARLVNSIKTAQSLHPEWNDQQAIEALIGAL